MQQGFQAKNFVKGALILTLAALMTKILSAMYRIPFQNMVGDVGFYIYQQVYPIYGVALVLSTTGYPVILSKLYAEQKNKEGPLGAGRLLVISAVFLFALGALFFSLLYWGAEWIAGQMNDPELAYLIRVTSFVFLMIPFTALLRGYFQGEGNMVPTALSQVSEQLIRVGTILVTAYIFIRANYNMYDVGGGAVFGSVTGALMGALVLITFLLVKKEYGQIPFSNLRKTFHVQETMEIIKTLMVQGFAVCVSSMLLIFMQLADSLNLYSLLLSAGMEGEEAKAAKGIYDRGQSLIQLGAVVATSMCLSLVPLIASEKFKSNMEALMEKINLAIRVSLTVGLGATVGLIAIMKPTNIMLFENSKGSHILAVLSIMILLGSIIITLIAILQGLGKTIFPAFVVLLGFVIKVGLNTMLVPLYGTMGAAFSSNLALALILTILIVKLVQMTKIPIISLPFLLKISFAAATMLLVLKGFILLTNQLDGFAHIRIMASIQSLSAVLIGGVTYLFVVVRANVFSAIELALLPFGSKIMYLFPNKNRR